MAKTAGAEGGSAPASPVLELQRVRRAGSERPPAAVDVVIPTRERPQRLAPLLDDLRQQDAAVASIVIVDDSAQPAAWERAFPDLPIQTVHPRPRAYISRAKNIGWKVGRAEFVAFVDDDNRLPSSLLRELSDDLRAHPTWGAVMPAVIYHRRPDLVWVYATPFQPDRWSFRLVGRNAERDPNLESAPLPTDALPNLSVVRRPVLEEVSGFDESFPVNSSADLCQRIKLAGWEAWSDPRVHTEHDVEPPGVPGYWAEHTYRDGRRLELEVADWIRFQRRWNRSGRFFRVRAGYHALGFVVPHLLAVAMRAPGRLPSHCARALAGFRGGLVTESSIIDR